MNCVHAPLKLFHGIICRRIPQLGYITTCCELVLVSVVGDSSQHCFGIDYVIWNSDNLCFISDVVRLVSAPGANVLVVANR